MCMSVSYTHLDVYKRQVKYRPLGAATLLRRNLAIYGLGGIIAPFIGIKLIDLFIAGIGMA